MQDHHVWQSARIHGKRRKNNQKKLYVLGGIILCILLYITLKIFPSPVPDTAAKNNVQVADSETNNKTISEGYVTASPSPIPTRILSKEEMVCQGKGMYDSLEEAAQSPEDVCLLHLNRTYLADFPKEILKFINLKVLDLSDNSFTHIPSTINVLAKLEILRLDGNNITTIPPQIGELVNLTELGLGTAGHRQNYITILPSTIGNLSKLERLDIAYNRLSTIPSDIGNLTNLRVLHLQHNNLTTFPQELSNLRNLEELYLNNNEFTLTMEEKEKIKSWFPKAKIYFGEN